MTACFFYSYGVQHFPTLTVHWQNNNCLLDTKETAGNILIGQDEVETYCNFFISDVNSNGKLSDLPNKERVHINFLEGPIRSIPIQQFHHTCGSREEDLKKNSVSLPSSHLEFRNERKMITMANL